MRARFRLDRTQSRARGRRDLRLERALSPPRPGRCAPGMRHYAPRRARLEPAYSARARVHNYATCQRKPHKSPPRTHQELTKNSPRTEVYFTSNPGILWRSTMHCVSKAHSLGPSLLEAWLVEVPRIYADVGPHSLIIFLTWSTAVFLPFDCDPLNRWATLVAELTAGGKYCFVTCMWATHQLHNVHLIAALGHEA